MNHFKQLSLNIIILVYDYQGILINHIKFSFNKGYPIYVVKTSISVGDLSPLSCTLFKWRI